MYGAKPIIGFRIRVIVEPDEVGFHAYCPALEGLHTYGDTKQEALQNAKDAAIAYLESSIKHHDPIPVGIVMQKDAKGILHTPRKRASHHTEDLTVACAII
jgi:predicted RNase H-like HicB family nuclease